MLKANSQRRTHIIFLLFIFFFSLIVSEIAVNRKTEWILIEKKITIWFDDYRNKKFWAEKTRQKENRINALELVTEKEWTKSYDRSLTHAHVPLFIAYSNTSEEENTLMCVNGVHETRWNYLIVVDVMLSEHQISFFFHQFRISENISFSCEISHTHRDSLIICFLSLFCLFNILA